MELRIFNSLRKLNRRFYDVYAESFSSSRHSIWPGWLRIADILETEDKQTINFLDVAAGNGRFEAFMAERFPATTWNALCIDPCEDLMSKAQGKLTSVCFGNMSCTPLSFDVLEFLVRDNDGSVNSLIVPEHFDMVVCFGFMHHVYSEEARELLMRLLINQAAQDGLVVVSFWCFTRDEAFAKKAEDQTRTALLSSSAQSLLGSTALDYREQGDYLLGWQGNVDIPRYCHCYNDDEISKLIQSVSDKAEMVDRFSADGRTGTMNEYVVLRVH